MCWYWCWDNVERIFIETFLPLTLCLWLASSLPSWAFIIRKSTYLLSRWYSNAQACNRWGKSHWHYSTRINVAQNSVNNNLYLIFFYMYYWQVICLFSSSCYLILLQWRGIQYSYTNDPNSSDKDTICIRVVWPFEECLNGRHWYCTVDCQVQTVLIENFWWVHCQPIDML